MVRRSFVCSVLSQGALNAYCIELPVEHAKALDNEAWFTLLLLRKQRWPHLALYILCMVVSLSSCML